MKGTLLLPDEAFEKPGTIVGDLWHAGDDHLDRIDATIERDLDPIEDAIVAILRYKRTRPDGLTAELNEIQRELEDRAGVTGVELAPEYDV